MNRSANRRAYSRGYRDGQRELAEKLLEVLYPEGDTEHEWSAEEFAEIARVLATVSVSKSSIPPSGGVRVGSLTTTSGSHSSSGGAASLDPLAEESEWWGPRSPYLEITEECTRFAEYMREREEDNSNKAP